MPINFGLGVSISANRLVEILKRIIVSLLIHTLNISRTVFFFFIDIISIWLHVPSSQRTSFNIFLGFGSTGNQPPKLLFS